MDPPPPGADIAQATSDTLVVLVDLQASQQGQVKKAGAWGAKPALLRKDAPAGERTEGAVNEPAAVLDAWRTFAALADGVT